MTFPIERLRRLRASESVRRLVRETRLHPHDMMAPLFVTEGKGIKSEIKSMPGQFRFSAELAAREAAELQALGVPAVLLFGVVEKKDSSGKKAWDSKGPVQQAIQQIKKAAPGMLVVTDVCLCEYTEHGHCGVVQGQKILNDPSLPLLARMALSHAEAGADWVAPSDMMDGRVGVIREAMDKKGLDGVAIMAYSAKFASAFYGPFRDAAGSAPSFGDRATYQMDPPNAREALREMEADLAEGADVLMVKPGLPYLDILAEARHAFDVPLAAYQVSGEYSMLVAAADRGWAKLERVRDESLLALKRAGADIVISYFAKDFARDFKSRGGMDAA